MQSVSVRPKIWAITAIMLRTKVTEWNIARVYLHAIRMDVIIRAKLD